MNMKLDISEVRKRKSGLSSTTISEGLINVNTVQQKLLKKYNSNDAFLVLSDWRSLDENTEIAVSKLFELFDVICENDTPQNITQAANTISSNITSKVRDANKLQYLVKRRLGALKTKISTKQQNSIADMHNSVTDKVGEIKKQIPGVSGNMSATDRHKEIISAAQESSALAGYNHILETCKMLIQCDRVLNNNDRLSKRFNFDKMITNSYITEDNLGDMIKGLCSLIDTYDVPFKIKYNVALENILYLFDNNGLEYTRKEIVSNVTDYFLEVNSSYSKDIDIDADVKFTKILEDMNYIIENNKFYDDLDTEEISHFISKGAGEAQYDLFFDNSDDTFRVDYNDARSVSELLTEANKTLNPKSKKTTVIKDILNKFKTIPNKSEEAIKTTINTVMTRGKDNIVEEEASENLLQWGLSIAVLCTAASFSLLLGMVAGLTLILINRHLERKETAKHIKAYKKAIASAEKKKENAKSEKEKERLTQYISKMQDGLYKLESWERGLYTKDELEKKEEDEKSSTSDSSSEDDFDFTLESGVIHELSFVNNLRLQSERLKKGLTNLSDKERTMSRTLDFNINQLREKVERSVSRDDREAVVRDQLLPSCSKIIKLAITTGLSWMVSPVLAVIVLMGSFVLSAKYRAKERQIVLDEIDTELEMTERYIRIAEEKNDMKALRNLLTIKKSLQRQRDRLKYKIAIEYNENLPDRNSSDDE